MSRINLFVDTHVQYAYLKSGIKVLADERDKKKFLDFVLRMQQEQKFEIYAFCILDNEAHFLLGVQEEENEKTEAILGEMGNWYTNHMREQQFQQKRRGRVTKCISGVKDMEKMLTVCLRFIRCLQRKNMLKTSKITGGAVIRAIGVCMSGREWTGSFSFCIWMIMYKKPGSSLSGFNEKRPGR